MKLSDYKHYSEKASAKLSDINRKIVFAGIAIVWIFTNVGEAPKLPDQLLIPAVFLVVSLVWDMVQYIYQTILWSCLFHRKENKYKKANGIKRIEPDVDPDVGEHSGGFIVPSFVFLELKIISTGVAYVYLLIYLFKELI